MDQQRPAVDLADLVLSCLRDSWRDARARRVEVSRTKPKPETVRAHAVYLVHQHGRDAYRINGEAMHKARLAKDFDRCRFLKEVSGELVRRRK
jgi:hypothetical protein